MEKTEDLTALLQFNSSGKLMKAFLNVDTDEEEKLIRKGLSKLIKPTLLGWIIGKLS